MIVIVVIVIIIIILLIKDKNHEVSKYKERIYIKMNRSW